MQCEDNVIEDSNSGIEIDATDHSVQNLAPPNNLQRFEGIAFSPSGSTIGVAASDTNTGFLFRRKPDGLFEDAPYLSIDGPRSKLNYPHDLSFSLSGETELLAVAQRSGSICIYQRNKTTNEYSTDPVFEIRGREAKLNYSDGVAFVPPDDVYLAVCNLKTSTITFYRNTSGVSVGFELKPVFRLKHRSLYRPDGLTFSQCGTWLAVANHGNHTVSIYERIYERRRIVFSGREVKYGPRPVSIIRDPGLRHPHSVAFTPKTNHLVVTNAGANYFSVYQPEGHGPKMRWSQSPVLQRILGPDSIFSQINSFDKMEGGPKGVAIHKNNLAVCSPGYGIRIYSFRENTL
jgi:DNA-binding beta-propeller fold protein YncE